MNVVIVIYLVAIIFATIMEWWNVVAVLTIPVLLGCWVWFLTHIKLK